MLKRLIGALVLASAVSLPAKGATIAYIEAGAPVDIPGVTGFVTLGSNMDTMSVTACFSVLGCEQRSWTDGIPTSGGVSGTGWGLSVTGDTFTPLIWQMEIDANVGQLESLLLDGSDAFVIFDRTEPSTGTPGSERGRDWFTEIDGTIDVTYINPTGVGGNPPVGDLFQMVFVEFLDLTGPRTSFTFSQDADNDIRFFQVPEPSSLALFGLAMLGMAFFRRRRSG
jgi:hypothetical protein